MNHIDPNGRNVFLYWTGTESPLILILRNLVYLHSTNGRGYQVHLITPANIREYLRDLPACFGKLCPAHQADVVRVFAVCEHGGIWIDSDAIVMDSLDALFGCLEADDTVGFLVSTPTELCNSIFGSRKQTPFLMAWKKGVTDALAKRPDGVIRWSEIGSELLDSLRRDAPLLAPYRIFAGRDTMCPVPWDQLPAEMLEKPYGNYQTIVRPFQPILNLVHGVYMRFRGVSEATILATRDTPLSYFLHTSFQRARQHLVDYDFIEIGTSHFDTLLQAAAPATVGLSVEPIKYYLDALPDNKPGVTKVHVAVSDVDSMCDMYHIPEPIIDVNNLPTWLKGCNSINKYHDFHLRDKLTHLVQITPVRVITAARLFFSHRVRRVGFLKIDTEGHDCVILTSLHAYLKALPAAEFYPRRIQFETNSHTEAAEVTQTIDLYCALGYALVHRGTADTVLEYVSAEPPVEWATVPILCINLDHRTDRLQQVGVQLAQLGRPFAAHGEGGALTERVSAVHRPEHGALGCSESHVMCLERAMHENWPAVLVLEDDFHCVDPDQLRKSVDGFLGAQPAYHWDVLVLGAMVQQMDDEERACARRLREAQSTTGYLVRAAYLPTLLDNMRTSLRLFTANPTNYDAYALDMYWKRLQARDKWYICSPLVVTQATGFSDIANQRLEHDANFLQLHNPKLMAQTRAEEDLAAVLADPAATAATTADRHCRLAKCQQARNDLPRAIASWLAAFDADPRCVEALYEIVRHYRLAGSNRLAYSFYEIADRARAAVGDETESSSEHRQDVRAFLLDYELSIVGFYHNPGHQYDLVKVSMGLLNQPRLPAHLRTSVLSNYQFYAPVLASRPLPAQNRTLLETLGDELMAPPMMGSSAAVCTYGPHRLLVVRRFVDYHLAPDGTYHYAEGGCIRTRNVLAVVDTSAPDAWRLASPAVEVAYDTALDRQYVGVEDVRLHCLGDGTVVYTGTRNVPDAAKNYDAFLRAERKLLHQDRAANCGTFLLVNSDGKRYHCRSEGVLLEQQEKDATDAFSLLNTVGPTKAVYGDFSFRRAEGGSSLQIEFGRLDVAGGAFVDATRLRYAHQTACEKNWALFQQSDGAEAPLQCVYQWHPLTVGEILHPRDLAQEERGVFAAPRTIETPALFQHFRGSSPGVPMPDNELWFLVHAVSHESPLRRYYHAMVALDRESLALRWHTPLFTFRAGATIEFSLGFAYDAAADQLLVGHSSMDRETHFLTVPRQAFVDMAV